MKNLDKCVIIGTILVAILFVIVTSTQVANPKEDLENVLEHCKYIHETYTTEYNIDTIKEHHIPIKEFVDDYDTIKDELPGCTIVIDNIILCEQYINWSIIEYESGYPGMAINSLETASNYYLIANEKYQKIKGIIF